MYNKDEPKELTKQEQETLWQEAKNAPLPPPINAKNLPPRRPIPATPHQNQRTQDFFIKKGNLAAKMASLNAADGKEIKKVFTEQQKRSEFQNVNVKETSKKLVDLFKTNHLSPFKQNITKVLKNNKGYTQAKQKCQTTGEQNKFEQTHLESMNAIYNAMEIDIENFVDKKTIRPKSMTEESFLIYSFLYRAYERCLELDFLKWSNTKFRHELYSTKNSKEYPEDLNYLILTEISLNYYDNFYKNVPKMKELDCWKNVDREIRKKEVWSVAPNYIVNGNTLEGVYQKFSSYITKGTGESIYTSDFKRLPSPNGNFYTALSDNGMHKMEQIIRDEMEQVRNKVNTDIKSRF